MSWFRKQPPQPVVAEAATPIMVPRGNVLLALTEECVALKIEAMTMAMLAGGVTRRLAGEAAAREFMDGVIDR